MVMVTALEPVPPPLVALTVAVDVPAAVGVPDPGATTGGQAGVGAPAGQPAVRVRSREVGRPAPSPFYGAIYAAAGQPTAAS